MDLTWARWEGVVQEPKKSGKPAGVYYSSGDHLPSHDVYDFPPPSSRFEIGEGTIVTPPRNSAEVRKLLGAEAMRSVSRDSDIESSTFTEDDRTTTITEG